MPSHTPGKPRFRAVLSGVTTRRNIWPRFMFYFVIRAQLRILCITLIKDFFLLIFYFFSFV
ncbi:hypothetical protein ACS0TY_033037 [Phlomoides rotata]